jgi:hypothetical protein
MKAARMNFRLGIGRLSLAFAVMAGATLGPSSARAADLSGMWWIKDRTETAQIDHKTLPLLPGAVEAYRRNGAAIRAGKVAPPGNGPCLPEGMPRLMLARYPFLILQRPNQVTIIHERMHLARLIYLNREQPADVGELDPWFDGHSVGKWDGDALVVDTAGLKANTVIDRTGIPHSDAMRLGERFTLEDGGETLRDVVTVTDPQTFSKPWSFTIDYAKRPDVTLMDDVCTYGPPERDGAKPGAAGQETK